MKKIKNQTTVIIEKCWEWHVLSFQKPKNYPQNTQKPKIKQLKKAYKEASNEKSSENRQ